LSTIFENATANTLGNITTTKMTTGLLRDSNKKILGIVFGNPSKEFDSHSIINIEEKPVSGGLFYINNLLELSGIGNIRHKRIMKDSEAFFETILTINEF
jgi:hypothetical protein